MDKVVRYLGMILLLAVVSSCIREAESDCVVEEYVIRVYVGDKNYSNVDTVSPEEKMDESMPFGKFIAMLYYTLYDAQTGALVRQQELMSKTDMGADYEIKLENLPYGRYKLTVWGDATGEVPSGKLHLGNQEGTDIFLSSSIIQVDAQQWGTDMMLKRTKGMLLVKLSNFPAYITGVGSNATHVFESVGSDFTYAGNTSILKTTSLQEEVRVLLAPSVGTNASKLQLQLFTDVSVTRATPAVTLPDIDLTIRRNEIAMVSVDYNVAMGTWEIWIYIAGKWTMVHSLDVDEISF